MKNIRVKDLQLWQFENLGREVGIRHFVTDRNSYPNGKEFTLSYSSSPDRDFIQRNRNLLADAMSVTPSELFMPSQVHLTRIVNVARTTSKTDLLDTDALITNEKGICI